MAVQRKKLGEMLVEAGLVTQEQLREILVEQSGSGLKLGEYLVNRDIIRESQIVDLISQQLKIEKFRADKHHINPQLAQLLPMEFAQTRMVAPLSLKGNLLVAAMTDPMDIQAQDEMEILTNKEVEVVICTIQEFNEILYSVYGVSTNISEDVMHRLEDLERAETDSGEESEAEEFRTDLNVSSLQDMAEEAPVVRLLNSILTEAVREGASDVHISPEKDYVQLRFRVDGKLRDAPAPPRRIFLPIVSRVKILAGMDIAVARVPQDGRFTFRLKDKEIHVRVSTLPTIHGENVVMRLLDRSGGVKTLAELGFSKKDGAKLGRAMHKPYGMILATGPTGSGKSTTLYAILGELNAPDVNIITLEDPVEYRIERIRQTQLNRKAGMTFASGLRAILRQDPDVIMVGEIRDGETANIAVQSALTGHRMLSTLHTNDSAGAVTRLMEMGVEPFLVASTLLVSIAQRLVRRICPHCREAHEPTDEALRALGLARRREFTFYKGRGCRMCNNSGYLGRIGLYEVLEIDSMVQELILRRASAAEITRAAVKAGALSTLKDDAARKAAQGLTTLEEAASAVLA